MTGESAYKTINLQDQYYLLRKKEGRIYSDVEVAHLPEIDAAHQYYAEWLIRKTSCRHLIKYLQAKRKSLEILEVGCGNGWLSAELSALQSTSVTGIDINSQELEQAKRVFGHVANLQFFNTNLQHEIISSRHFDIIVFAASVQYFPSLKAVLNDLWSRLKPNGEIHFLDSNFYRPGQVEAARQRSVHYFKSIGFPEMIDQYFHHSLSEIKQFNYKILYDPHAVINRIKKNRNPFYWICIKKNNA